VNRFDFVDAPYEQTTTGVVTYDDFVIPTCVH